jgi:hypothetical protein
MTGQFRVVFYSPAHLPHRAVKLWTKAIVCFLSWHAKSRFDNLAIHQDNQSFHFQKGSAGQDRIRYGTGQFEPCLRRHVQ